MVTRAFLLLLSFVIAPAALGAHRYFEIRVEDRATGRPIPGVKLETTNRLIFLSDVNGRVAFYEPGLMGTRVHFRASRSGYQAPADGFDIRGKTFDVVEGGTGTIQMDAAPPDGGVPAVDDTDSLLLAGDVPERAERFRIAFVDAETGRGVPLVIVTVGDRTLVSDSNGLIAFHDPHRMNTDVELPVFSHGYRLSGVAAGSSIRVRTTAGGGITVQLSRDNIAERLYRVTGQGIYRDTNLLGEPAPTQRPVENGLVMGQDSVQSEIHRGRIVWFWGDTNRPAYPLGNFHASGAVSDLPGAGGLDPSVGVNLRYFTDGEGFSRGMAPPSTVPGNGITWFWSVASLPSDGGASALFATYAKVLSLGRESESGIIRYNDATDLFEKVLVFSPLLPERPEGHPLRVSHADGDYLYFHRGLRFRATAEAYVDTSAYESFTPFVQGGSTIERDAEGKPVYGWKRATKVATEDTVTARLLSRGEALTGHTRDVLTGNTVLQHGASTEWSAYRDRYVRIFVQAYGSPSFLGETWYAEADTPFGPWVYARKILTHQTYTSYNPRHHPFFDQEGGRLIYFEGTYTESFSGSTVSTPYYDYNQMMYRLNLADERLVLPVPVYAIGDGFGTRRELRPWMAKMPAAFLAPDRPMAGLEPVGWTQPSCDGNRRLARGAAVVEPLFFAPSSDDSPAGDTVALFEYRVWWGGLRVYALDGQGPAGYERVSPAVARVWRNPASVGPAVRDYLPLLTAHAGDDLCVKETQRGEGAKVTLDGSRSSHARGTIAAYQWSWREGDAQRSAEGATPEITLPVGTHRIELSVTGSDGVVTRDHALVKVADSSSCGCGSLAGFIPAWMLLLLAAVSMRLRIRR